MSNNKIPAPTSEIPSTDGNTNQFSKGVILDPSFKRMDSVSEKKKVPSIEKENLNFTLKLYKNYKIEICKPLISLKLALFLWYGAGSVMQTFISVFFKQRGLTLVELSTIHIINPSVQLLYTIISGVIVDKIGRSKPLLVFNLLSIIMTVIGILSVPRMNALNCQQEYMTLTCHHLEVEGIPEGRGCKDQVSYFQFEPCCLKCSENETEHCRGTNLTCKTLQKTESPSKFIFFQMDFFNKSNDHCQLNIVKDIGIKISDAECSIPNKLQCQMSGNSSSEGMCCEENKDRTKLLLINMILVILFFVTLSNTYRFMDVTSMTMAKEYNSHYGRERFFSVAGILVFSPIAGFVVDQTTAEGQEKNYEAAFYLFIAMVIAVLLFVYKLKVQMSPPGQQMWKKALGLLQNPDVLAFVVVLFVLGTSWSFSKNFVSWYLEGLNAPSVLLGLIPAIGGLYGLFFLLSSSWWVKKIGTTQLFILGLLGYVVYGIGFSLLINPWISLLLEATNIFTYHLLWVAVVVHSHTIAPEGLTATVISAAGAFHYNVGKGSGSLIGGMIMNAFGGRVAFRVIAAICLTCAVLYSLYLYIRRTFFTKKHTLKQKDGIKNEIFVLEDQASGIYTLQSAS